MLHKTRAFKGAVILVLAAFVPLASFADQVFTVKDGDSVIVKMSSRELTRLMLDGPGKLKKVFAPQQILDIQADTANGEAYIRPTSTAASKFSFFVKDDLGNTYTLIAEQYDIPSQTIKLKPTGGNKKALAPNEVRKSTRHKEAVKGLMKAMANGDDVQGYSIENADVKVPLWRETEIVLRGIYSGPVYTGEIYSIKNLTSEDQVFSEAEFLDFGDSVEATALRELVVQPSSVTLLFVVRMPNGQGVK